jgi:hypothetical protein
MVAGNDTIPETVIVLTVGLGDSCILVSGTVGSSIIEARAEANDP